MRTARRRCTLAASLAIVCACWLTAPAPSVAADPEPQDYSAELPRVPPVEPDKALSTFRVAKGFQLELAAAEPLVASPVAIAFDENGRMFVAEMRDYSEQDQEHLGRVRVLEDTNDDGRFDRAGIYLEGLSWPTAIACYDGGVFVAAAPDLIYAKDTDGDGRADVRRVVLTGFRRDNVQGLVNSLTWGLDNRIRGATSTAGADLRPPDQPQAKPLALRGRDFAFDPRSMRVEATSGGGQHGMSFDEWGRKFVCSNSDHIQLVMFEDRYVARNPYLAAPSPRVSIAADGPQAEVFRSSPVEPWRIVRTRLRLAGTVPGPIEGGGRAAGYFTGATGVTIYRGDAWPDAMRGLAIVGDVGSNLVHRKRLEPRGVELVAQRIDEGSEFVASTDIWFRPAQFANGPDGALYVVDVYREVIEHPASLPPVIKRHLDLTSGRDRGRIYRIVPEGFQRRPQPRLGQAATSELVALLAHPNGWHRETVSRLLYERQDPAAAVPLERMARESAAPLGRMHALYALSGLGRLTPEIVLAALQDADARVRAHAVRLAEPFVAESQPLRERLQGMAEDDDLLVRYQVAFSLGELPTGERIAPLITLAKREAADRWMRLAILSSLAEGGGEVFARLLASSSFRSSEGGRQLLEELAALIAASGDTAAAGVLDQLDALPAEGQQTSRHVLRGLALGLERRGGSLAALVKNASSSRAASAVADVLESARRRATDANLAVDRRLAAIRELSLGGFDTVGPTLISLVDQRQPLDVQAAAIESLSKLRGAQVALALLEAWPRLSPRLRAAAADALMSRGERVVALLDSIQAGTFATADLEPQRLDRLRAHPDPSIRDRALKLLGPARESQRQQVVDAYSAALTAQGDAARGKLAFQKKCAACHRVDGAGHELGPSLAAAAVRGPEALLLAVLDPNREVNPQFVDYLIITTDGRTATGLVTAETATSVTLTRAEGLTETILRADIEEMSATGKSLMPEGMEQEFDVQAMGDLIAYLRSLK